MQDDPGGSENYVQRWYVRREDGAPVCGMVQLVAREDGGLLVQLDHLDEDDGKTDGSTALFFRPEEAEHFRTLAARTGRGKTMRQVAPWPEILERLVGEIEYRRGWSFSLADTDRGQGSAGLTFTAIGMYPDSYHPDNTIRVAHYFPVPPAAYNEASWRRWLLDRILEIERHEACEFFQLGGERPYAPHHGPGNDPYIVFDHGSDIEARTSFRGEVKDDQAVARNITVDWQACARQAGWLPAEEAGLETARQEADRFAEAVADAEPDADDDCGGGGR